MPERDPSFSSDLPEGFEPDFYVAEIERYTQHQPAVAFLVEQLSAAEELDASLKRGDPAQPYPLERRFVVFSGGNEAFPFTHKRISYVPKKGAGYKNLEGIMIRYAVTPKEKGGDGSVNNRITISFGIAGGITANFYLGETEYEPFTDASELRIENGELLGVARPQHQSPLNFMELQGVLQNCDQELQSNETPRAE